MYISAIISLDDRKPHNLQYIHNKLYDRFFTDSLNSLNNDTFFSPDTTLYILDKLIKAKIIKKTSDNYFLLLPDAPVHSFIKCKKPKMILFDYGNTLVKEPPYNPILGYEAILSHATQNPNNVTPSQIVDISNRIDSELGRYDKNNPKKGKFEFHNFHIQKYIYDLCGLKFELSFSELEYIFWSTACPGKPTPNVSRMLHFLHEKNIRSGIISNLSFGEEALSRRISELVPGSDFEFLIGSSEYVFRKPSKRIFEVALAKARLDKSEVWYVGDSSYFDVDAATSAGIQAIWYTGSIVLSEKPLTKKYFEVNSWTEFMQLLEIFM